MATDYRQNPAPSADSAEVLGGDSKCTGGDAGVEILRLSVVIDLLLSGKSLHIGIKDTK